MQADLFKNNKITDRLNVKGVEYRESCDSNDNPNSTPIIIGVDVTGSMGYLSTEIVKKSLNTLFTEIYDKKPVSDPHIMFNAIGDGYTDISPFQATQFEADIRIAEQMQDVYIEGHGGGNGGESYLLTWYFAARHTKIDSFDKRNKKGYIFTIGDEPNHRKLTVEQVKRIFGDDIECNLTAKELLNEVSRQYEVFHLLVGNYERHGSLKSWNDLLGERAMQVSDHTKIPEIIVSTLDVLNGKDVDNTTSQWDGSTAVVVSNAIRGLSNINEDNGLIEF